ncbi:DUF6499 domain-containing protein [Mesorhizobium sp. GbtcB19]|uniref:transcriptional regulator domain-containing protein n=1 Tax=Mesorhizobium sp. GbtcB19 TaxID=2824764 RepID=UPI0034D6A19C
MNPGPAWPDWQDDHSYAYCTHLTSRGWAWEFLRRNATFRERLNAALQVAERSRSPFDHMVRLSPRGTVDLSPWALLFCKLQRKFRERVLVPPPLSACSPPCRRTCASIAPHRFI